MRPWIYVRHRHVRRQIARHDSAIMRLLALLTFSLLTSAWPAPIYLHDGGAVSPSVFESLEELARIVDISYCVGSTGIQKPFRCLSRCSDFEGFELVTTWNTGPLLSDSCGYIAISHEPFEKRVLVVFRGTYSIANTIADLSTRHADYLPFPAENDTYAVCAQTGPEGNDLALLPQLTQQHRKRSSDEPQCRNCTVHSGFLTSWQNTRCIIIPHVEQALERYPDYKLVLVGHSLGGAVATIAGLELKARGYNPFVTTFGEPRVGNKELNRYINREFHLDATSPDEWLFRRVTHVEDPVPLLPPEEWGYDMHSGEIFISKSSLPARRIDLRACDGDSDPACIAGGGTGIRERSGNDSISDEPSSLHWHVPSRYKLWELFFAHRDYFWRLGLCIPSGDPWDWNRSKLEPNDITINEADL